MKLTTPCDARIRGSGLPVASKRVRGAGTFRPASRLRASHASHPKDDGKAGFNEAEKVVQRGITKWKRCTGSSAV